MEFTVEKKSYDEIISLINQVIESKNAIDVVKILLIIECSGLNYKEKYEILSKVHSYNLSIITALQNENNILKNEEPYDPPVYSNIFNDSEDIINQEDLFLKPIKKINKQKSIHTNNIIKLNNFDEIKEYLDIIDYDCYVNVINDIIVDILENITMIKKMQHEEYLFCGKNDSSFDDELNKYTFILNCLFKLRQIGKIDDSKMQNKIIYLTTEYGNINIVNDFKSIPIEFYDSIYNLINSIKNNNIKNVKRLGTQNNNFKTNMLQLRDNDVRLIFDVVEPNTYVILSIFVKKVNTSKDYFNNLRNVDVMFYKQLPDIKSKLENERDSYIEQNDMITDSLIEKLLMKDKDVCFDGNSTIKNKIKSK